MRYRLLASALLLMSSFCLAADKTYPVQLEHPGKTGQKYDIRFTVAYKDEVNRVVGRREPEIRTSVNAVELDAQVEVLETDSRGQESKIAVTLRKCVQVLEQKETEVLPKGSVVLAEVKEVDTVLSLKGGKLTAEQEAALGQVISLAPAKARTLDQTYGSTLRRKVGDKWDIDRAALAEHLAAHRVQVKPEAIKGTTTLIDIEDRDGKRQLHFKIETTIDGYRLAPAEGEGAKESEVEFKGIRKQQSIELWVPEDASDIGGRASVNMDDHYTFTGKGEGRAAYKADFKTTRVAVMVSKMVRE